MFIQKIQVECIFFSFFFSKKRWVVRQAVAVICTNQMTRHCLTFKQFTWSIGRRSRVVRLFIILQILFICYNRRTRT